jgi:hypothetical protein
MNISKLSHFSTKEIVAFVVFAVYILFPIPTPSFLRTFLHSAVGMIVLLLAIGGLFMVANPILGVISIFVAYELLRRSSFVNFMNTPDKGHQGANSQIADDANADHKPFELPVDTVPEVPHSFAYKSLEEEIVDLKAPVGHSSVGTQFLDSTYQPVADKLDGASLF